MTREEGFLRAICAEPDDDGPRLVYADWLEEHRHLDRAEFIRVQCALARLPEQHPLGTHLKRQEQNLLRQHAPEWLAPFEPWHCDREDWFSFSFHRGFVEQLSVWTEPFLMQTEELFALTPLRHVGFVRLSADECGRLADEPLLLRLRSLYLQIYEMRGGGLDRLLTSPHLANLQRLDIPGTESLYQGPEERCPPGEGWVMNTARVGLLTHSSHLQNLRELSLPRHVLDVNAVELLAGSATLAELTHLDLYENSLRDAGALALASSQYLKRVEVLDLRWNAIGPSGRAALRARFGERVVLEPEEEAAGEEWAEDAGDGIPF
jgi:uncharacterized protein (TIGR02996 family)